MNNSFAAFTAKRTIFYVAGIILYALGVCMLPRVNWGISAIISIPYLSANIIGPLSFARAQFILNCLLIAIQALWMGRQFPKLQYLQFAGSFIFIFFLNILEPFTYRFDHTMLTTIPRVILFSISLILMAIGAGTMSLTNFPLLPVDGVAKVMAWKFRWSFGRAKVITDCACISITSVIIVMLAPYQEVGLDFIRFGTVVSALLLGHIAWFYINKMGPFFKFREQAAAVEKGRDDLPDWIRYNPPQK